MVGARETGNETYVLNLLQNLPQVDAALPLVYRAIVLDPGEISKRVRTNEHLRLVGIRPSASWVRIPVSMPILAAREKLDLLHVTYVTPPYCPCPTVVTVHDIAFKLYPEFFPARVRLILSMLVPPSMRRAARVITVSESAKRDIIAHYGIPESKIAVTHEAAAAHYCVTDDRGRVEEVKQRYGIERDFILIVGNLQPRKNTKRLIQAYARLPATLRKRYRLVVVGQALWLHSDVYRAIAEHDLHDSVTFTGYVSDADLVLLYNAASLFVYPSIYEGFGLPVLEAMACGTPVITSNCSSLPEVAGQAAILVDPTDIDEIARAMASVVTDPTLARSLSTIGRERASTFSWQQTARQTAKVYAEVLNALPSSN
jgi:glycosyltransferase involved in cell wall biosynthesis